MNQQSLRRGADLAGVVEAAVHRALDRGVDVGVGEDDEGAVAAQLEQLRLQNGGRRDLLSGGGRSGEEDAVDVVVADDRRPDVAEALNDVDHSRGKPGLAEQLGHHRAAGGRELGRLPDRRVAGGDDVRERDRGDVGREVVGGDRADHSQRPMGHDQALVVRLLLGGWEGEAAMAQHLGPGLLVGRRGVLVDLFAGVRDRLADLERDHARDRLRALEEELVDPPQDLDAVDQRHRSPAGLRLASGGNRSVHVARVAAGDDVDDLPRVRRAHLEGAAAALDPISPDQCTARNLGGHAHTVLQTCSSTPALGSNPIRNQSHPG